MNIFDDTDDELNKWNNSTIFSKKWAVWIAHNLSCVLDFHLFKIVWENIGIWYFEGSSNIILFVQNIKYFKMLPAWLSVTKSYFKSLFRSSKCQKYFPIFYKKYGVTFSCFAIAELFEPILYVVACTCNLHSSTLNKHL